MNWTISEVKSRGKATFKAAYWRCVLVAFVISVVSGGLSTFNFSGNYNFKDYINEDGSVDFSAMGSASYDNKIGELAEELVSSPNFWMIIALVVIISLFVMAISIALSAFLLTPLIIGCQRFFKEAGEKRSYELGNIVFAFSNNYMNIVKISFMMTLRIFLWSLLLIIPGIIKSYEYRMIPYILGDEPDISMEEAFRRSKELMTGNKWHSFLLDLSFIGWILLSILTCGILLIFYVNPYIAATDADLYLTLKGAPRNFDALGNQPYGQPPYGQNQYRQPYGQGQMPYGNAPGQQPPYGRPGQPYGAPGQPPYGNQGQPYGQPPYGGQGQPYGGANTPGNAPQPESGSYTDGEYRELNAYDDAPVSTPPTPKNETPAFGDERNRISGKDRPFNTPY